MAEFPIRKAGTEHVGLSQAEGRILAEEILAPENVPAFTRSMVDGYAVIAADVSRASREQPVRLLLFGEVVMGKAATGALESGRAVAVPTGGAGVAFPAGICSFT